jgi:nitrogen regulatory protein P-II 1
MKRIEAIIKAHKLDEVKDRLHRVGTSGMTVHEVRGFGRTDGRFDDESAAHLNVELVPNVYIQIVADDEMVHPIVEAIADSARTGEIGDGKIFVSPVSNALRIRTGERDAEAL